jgi:hypothetical protein
MSLNRTKSNRANATLLAKFWQCSLNFNESTTIESQSILQELGQKHTHCPKPVLIKLSGVSHQICSELPKVWGKVGAAKKQGARRPGGELQIPAEKEQVSVTGHLQIQSRTHFLLAYTRACLLDVAVWSSVSKSTLLHRTLLNRIHRWQHES